ncbi:MULTISPECIES: hypothetical protein [unclassified Burkholderia]|uniref:hypothetical protein n=1 Tax=unclassified Burkholderia TaxID=2613784 RepID=UPI002AB11599|nr:MULTISPECIES: hypothetical protein [unclassified Burkholderia]
MTDTTFNVGDIVTWSSQANGSTKTKTGVVEAIVLPKTYPDRACFPQLHRGSGTGLYRAHVSYVVRVPGKTSKSVGKLYWPRAVALRKA